jgi:hypothetical protein
MDLQEPGMRAYKARQINKDSNKFYEATMLPRSNRLFLKKLIISGEEMFT